MSLVDIMSAVKKINQFSDGKNWSGSHNDVPLEAVENVGLGSDGSLLDPRLWVRARFREDGKEGVVRGEHDLLRNHISITYGLPANGDGANVTSADELVLSNRLVTTQWRIVLEYVFKVGDKTHRYRFDGNAINAGDIVKGVII